VSIERSCRRTSFSVRLKHRAPQKSIPPMPPPEPPAIAGRCPRHGTTGRTPRAAFCSAACTTLVASLMLLDIVGDAASHLVEACARVRFR
jgi:hypothetical protein